MITRVRYLEREEVSWNEGRLFRERVSCLERKYDV